jgi:hypothetical protein
MLLRMPKSVREWTLTLSSELPCWELESQWTLESSERNCRGQNPSAWRVLYIIGKLSKLKCLKWACIAHLDISNTSYDQKKGQELNWQFDSRPLKVENRPNFLACKRRATYHWKVLDEGYIFALDLIVIGGLHAKLWGPKVVGVPTMRISRLPLGSLGTKCHLDVVPMERRREYYKGEGGGFPQVRVVVSLVNPSCSWLVLTPKVLQLCTNHLVLILCKSVWVIEACQFFLVPSRSSSMPFYPSKMLRSRERAPIPCFFVVFFFYLGLIFESVKESKVRHFVFLWFLWILDLCFGSLLILWILNLKIQQNFNIIFLVINI